MNIWGERLLRESRLKRRLSRAALERSHRGPCRRGGTAPLISGSPPCGPRLRGPGSKSALTKSPPPRRSLARDVVDRLVDVPEHQTTGSLTTMTTRKMKNRFTAQILPRRAAQRKLTATSSKRVIEMKPWKRSAISSPVSVANALGAEVLDVETGHRRAVGHRATEGVRRRARRPLRGAARRSRGSRRRTSRLRRSGRSRLQAGTRGARRSCPR